MIERLLSPALVDALGWTIIHSLWQGALFALLLGFVLIVLRSYSAQSRYLVSVGFLVAFFVAVGMTFAGQLNHQAEPRSVQARPSQAEPRSVQARPSALDPLSVRNAAEQAPERFEVLAYFDRHLPLIVTLWLMGVLVLQLRFLGQLVYIQRLKSYATESLPDEWIDRLRKLEKQLSITRAVRYLTSTRVDSAFTTGWWRPVVMLPADILQELKKSQLIAIFAHELAHVKRNDFAVNLLQILLGTFFFYHPGVWWMSARIHDEREHCCDDLAIEITGERIDYARTLVQLREKELIAPKLAMAYGGVGFGGRIKRVLSGYLGTATFGEGVVTTLILGATLSLAMAATGNTDLHAEAVPENDALREDLVPASAVKPTRNELEEHIETLVMNEFAKEGIVVPRRDDEEDPTDEFGMLMRSIYSGDTELFRYLVEKVDDLSRLDRQGFTPLMAAASENDTEIARLLIDRGVDVNQVSTENGWTALIEAADEGSFEVARLLIENGADVNLKGADAYRNALDMAASEGHPGIIKLLMDNGATEAGSHALHLAANEGQTDIVHLLLNLGFAVDARDDRGRTALMHAASENQTEVVRILLKAGANSELLDREGYSAMAQAAEEGATSSLREMTDKMGRAAMQHLITSPEILLGPAGEGELLTVEAMLATGIDVNITDDYGNTALSEAAREGHVDVVRFLLGRGARVQAGGGAQCSPVFLAAQEGHSEVVRLLVGNNAAMEDGCSFREIDHGNGITTVTIYGGAPPLTVAILEGHDNTAALLLRLGSDANQTLRKESYTLDGQLDWPSVNVLNSDELKGRSTVHYATDNWTPLLEATEGNRIEIVRLLLKAGADKDHKSTDGTSALSLARSLGYRELEKLLD